MLIHGNCHCGNIAFTLHWEPDPERIPARACSCSFCTRHGGVWTSLPSGRLEVTIKEHALVSRYAFGTQTADFHVCARCGVVPVVTDSVDGRLYAVVNVNTFDDAAAALVERAPVVFADEDAATRSARHQRNWIGDVRFSDTGG